MNALHHFLRKWFELGNSKICKKLKNDLRNGLKSFTINKGKQDIHICRFLIVTAAALMEDMNVPVKKRKCVNFELSYKVLSQQKLLHSLITFSLLSNKFCFFLKYSHFSGCCSISYLSLRFWSGNQKQHKLLKNVFDTTVTC